INDLDALYRAANRRFADDESFADRARRRVVALQAGDPRSRELWQQLTNESKRHYEAIYERLDLVLEPADYMGESVYNHALSEVCDALTARGLAVEHDGALCVFVPGFAGRNDRPLPVILRKRDGGFGYETTDVAAIRYRVGTLG